MNIYADAVKTLIPNHIDHHKSDLYLLMTNESLELINAYRRNGGEVQQVIDRRTGLYWYFLPWAYMPYWQRHYRRITEQLAWKFISINEHTPYLQDWSDANFDRTYMSMRRPPSVKLYPGIRAAVQSILSAYGIEGVSFMIPA